MPDDRVTIALSWSIFRFDLADGTPGLVLGSIRAAHLTKPLIIGAGFRGIF